jgi:hypothetical protein
MAIKDLIPWNSRSREMTTQRGNDVHPFLALHREMNRMFDDAFRGFDLDRSAASEPAKVSAGRTSTSTKRRRTSALRQNCRAWRKTTLAWRSRMACF